MTLRNVHFAEHNQYYSPTPPTPEQLPGWYQSSPSTVSFQTPPPIQTSLPFQTPSSFQTTPPFQTPSSFQTTPPFQTTPSFQTPYLSEIHPILTSPLLQFDVTQGSATVYHYYPELRATQNEPALNSPKLTIVSRRLPWKLDIHGSNGLYVTIGDVIEGIWRGIRTRVSWDEYNREGRSRQNETTVAFHERVNSYPDGVLRDAERDGGIRRVDFLNGCHIFAGLSATDKPHVWRLGLRK